MAKTAKPKAITEIYPSRQPRRHHYLREWMERRQVRQAELSREIGVDKSLISRWLDDVKPTTPSKEWQDKLGAFFGGDGDPVDIFRHPDDDWIARFFQGRTSDEINRMKLMLEAAFPKAKTGT